jgi:NADPH:quinone reductase-like Zn-dependent oxidoreductase
MYDNSETLRWIRSSVSVALPLPTYISSSQEKLMKAVTITANGGPEVVRVDEVQPPEPAVGEVAVEVRAAALNHLDLWVRKGRRGAAMNFPHVLGSDAAGVVAGVGDGVTGVAPGDEVVINPGLFCGRCESCQRGEQSECLNFSIVGAGRWGTFAERVVVPAANLFPKPPHLDFAEAAALPLAHVTAWRMLMTRARLRPGETVLIHGIGGGVALAALQIARLAGATCIVTSSSDDKLARAAALGARHAVNYRSAPDLATTIRDLTGGRGVDIVFDTVGAAAWPVSIAAVRVGGRIVTCGVTTGQNAEMPLQTLYWNQLNILGSRLGSQEDFRLMLLAVAAAKLRPVIDKAFPLDRAPEAFARMETGGQFGKIVLNVGG